MWLGWWSSDRGLHWQAVACGDLGRNTWDWERMPAMHTGLGVGGGWKDERQTPLNEWIQKYACNLWMTSFLSLNLHTSFYGHRWKPHNTVPQPRRSVLTLSALPAHPPLPSTHRRTGAGHVAVPGERCYQQQEEYCFGTKLLAKAPASLLNAATLGRRAGCSSSEYSSSHWWWQCRGAMAHPQLSARGKN